MLTKTKNLLGSLLGFIDLPTLINDVVNSRLKNWGQSYKNHFNISGHIHKTVFKREKLLKGGIHLVRIL